MNDHVEAAFTHKVASNEIQCPKGAGAAGAPRHAESRPAALAWKLYRRSHARTTRLLDRQECRTFLIARNTDHSNT